ncbi:MAG TPA: hypothetical protein VM260_18065 [Pirellula sp.]|nr:hypothetical protein [Pirellula sp.]
MNEIELGLLKNRAVPFLRKAFALMHRTVLVHLRARYQDPISRLQESPNLRRWMMKHPEGFGITPGVADTYVTNQVPKRYSGVASILTESQPIPLLRSISPALIPDFFDHSARVRSSPSKTNEVLK